MRKHKHRRIFALVLAFVVLLCISGLHAFAATVTQDGLEVTLVTNKAEYSANEQIKTTLTVKNNNDTAVENVNLETALPEGYALADKSENKKTVESVAAGESVSLEVTLTKNATPDEPSTNPNSSTNPVSGGNNGGSGTTTGGTTSGSAVQTGQGIMIVGIMLLVLLSTGFVFVFVYRKKHVGKKLLSVILCIGVIGSSVFLIRIPVNAEETKAKSISISETVKIGKNDLVITSVVKYGSDSIEIDPAEAEKYYRDSSEEVVKITDAKESADVPSEKEVTKLLSDRGFITDNIVTDYTMDAEFLDEAKIDENSTEKHPIYKMLYGSESEILWNVFVINGVVSAYPVSYNLVSERQAVLLITETDTVTSYDYTSNRFFETIPKESTMIVRKVSRIDKETLDSLTIGGLSEL